MNLSRERLEILYQCFIAFGHGTGGLRVGRHTCMVFQDYLLSALENEQKAETLVTTWGTSEIGTQILERVRAMGRTAAILASAEGKTVIRPTHLREATRRVTQSSSDEPTPTPFCPPLPDGE